MRLSDAQIRQYHEQGYLCPIRVFSPERAAAVGGSWKPPKRRTAGRSRAP